MATDSRPIPPAEVLRNVRADPWHGPEIVALAAAEYHAPMARRWHAEVTARYDYEGAHLARMATAKHATLARFGGAAMGFGGLLTMLPDIVGLAWIQSRLVFYIAAAYGFDPADPMRPAELLVLQRVYEDPGEARKALDLEGKALAAKLIEKSVHGEGATIERLTRMVGSRAGKRLAGKAIPGFAVLFNAYSNEKETRKLARHAMRFYGG